MKYSIVFLVVFIFVGCVSKEDFPTTWNKIENSSTCLDISGSFINTGEVASKDYSPKLTEFLFPNVKDSDQIKIVLDKNILKIQAYLDNKLLSENNASICEDGKWTVGKDESLNNGGALGKEWDTFYLNKSVDGLVIKRKNSAVGLLFFIPVVGSSTSWILFRNFNTKSKI